MAPFVVSNILDDDLAKSTTTSGTISATGEVITSISAQPEFMGHSPEVAISPLTFTLILILGIGTPRGLPTDWARSHVGRAFPRGGITTSRAIDTGRLPFRTQPNPNFPVHVPICSSHHRTFTSAA